MKKISISLAVLCLLAFSAPAWAANDAETMFKNHCGACHLRGGEAAPVNPGEKAGRVWVKYFKRGRHPAKLNIPEGEMESIIEYLEDHAADSDQPQMSVIPQ